MYKAVLVDDENYDLEGLNKLIPWSELNVEVVYSINKPLSALEYIRNHPVDILITDIKMPVHSGIELAKKSLEHKPNLNIIFISGYEDFQYAKEALLLKACGYILKPVDDNEIISLVKETVTRLDSEQLKRLADVSLQQSFHYVKSNFINHLLEGTFEKDKLASLLQDYGVKIRDSGMLAVIVEIDDVILKLNTLTMEQQRSELQAIIQLVVSYVETNQLGLHCKLSHFQMGLVLYITNEDNIKEQMNSLVRFIKENSKLSITLGVGFEVTDAESLWKSFDHAKKMLNYKMFLGKNRVITMSTSKMGMVAGFKDFNEIYDAMFNAMEYYQLVKIDDCIEDLFVLTKSFEQRVTVYNFAIHIISKLESYLHKRNETFESLLGWERNHLDLIYKFETIEDIKSWLRRMMFEISEMIYLKRNTKNSRFFDDVLKYLESRLYNDVTLRDVANYFSYSPNHLGLLFKDYFSESFSDYVIRMRMEKAEELLHTPALKVYEIADMLGYKSLTYFSRQFREYYGTSPGDYRKQV
jgi:two-component system response regulator YesN